MDVDNTDIAEKEISYLTEYYFILKSSKVVEILPPKQLPRQHSFINRIKSLHLLSKDEKEVFTSLFRIRSRISKVMSVSCKYDKRLQNHFI